MKRRSLTLLILGCAVLLLAGVGGLVAWHPWMRATAETGPAGPPPTVVTLSELDQSLLRSVQLISAAGTIELDDVEGAWKIVKPAELPVKAGPLSDLLYSLTNLWSERIVEGRPASLAPYGLEHPAVTIRMTLTTGEVRELYLGDRTPAGDSYYIMRQGDPAVYTVREHHGTYFHYGVRELWGGGYKPIDGNDIVYILLRKAGRTIVELRRTPDLYRNDIEFRSTTISVVYPWETSPKPADLSFVDRFARGFTSLASTIAVERRAEGSQPLRPGLPRGGVGDARRQGRHAPSLSRQTGGRGGLSALPGRPHRLRRRPQAPGHARSEPVSVREQERGNREAGQGGPARHSGGDDAPRAGGSQNHPGV